MKLEDMKCGDTATVVTVSGSGQLRKRVLDLGLTRGTEVKMIRIAPLGDPVEIELRVPVPACWSEKAAEFPCTQVTERILLVFE